MDPLIEEIIEILASSEKLRKETIRQVVLNSFRGTANAIRELHHVKYTFPYFGSFSLNRKQLLRMSSVCDKIAKQEYTDKHVALAIKYKRLLKWADQYIGIKHKYYEKIGAYTESDDDITNDEDFKKLMPKRKPKITNNIENINKQD